MEEEGRKRRRKLQGYGDGGGDGIAGLASCSSSLLDRDPNTSSSSCSRSRSRSRSRSSLLPTVPPDKGKGVDVGAAAVDADRISGLPDGVLDSILSRLQINELLRTSILSRRWRHLWTSAPLDITDFFLYGVTFKDHALALAGDFDCYQCSLLRSMATILAHHRGPIRSFSLSWPTIARLCVPHDLPPPIVDYPHLFDVWTETMAQRGLNHFTVKAKKPTPPYLNKIPPNLLTCHSLQSLELINYRDLDREPPSLPPNLRELKLGTVGVVRGVYHLGALSPGILACHTLRSLELSKFCLKETFGWEMPPNLRELRLRLCPLSDSIFDRLLSNCPLLDTLDLHISFRQEQVRISSLSLRKLTLRFFNKYQVQPRPPHLLIGHVPNLQLLTLAGRPPEHLNNACSDSNQLDQNTEEGLMRPSITQISTLKAFSIEVSLDDVYHTRLLADMLSRFPCLESLDIEVSEHCTSPVDEDYWEHESPSDCLYHHLKVVELKGFSGQPNHLRFARYLIRNAPTLKVISILCQREHKKRWVRLVKDTLPVECGANLDIKVIVQPRVSERRENKRRDFTRRTTIT